MWYVLCTYIKYTYNILCIKIPYIYSLAFISVLNFKYTYTYDRFTSSY